MKQIFTLLILLTSFYKPTYAHTHVPFTKPSHFVLVENTPAAKLIKFEGGISNNKVILNWVVKENNTADQFEVEKSTDGKNFVMAALVFGTDKSDTDKYQFYEKAYNKKVMYRIKLINKNKKTEYSQVIAINPVITNI
ncbi:MAG TPA: hypothetical protein VLJ68_10410 [Chitinophagaceae bacterium]|nr:hypothetical protein [Chitinophagaceae bacterium]